MKTQFKEQLTCLEMFAGAGGLAQGMHQAGIQHLAFVERNKPACETLRLNFPAVEVFEGDIREFHTQNVAPIDILSGGPPCQPFSLGGKAQGNKDKRDMFPYAIRVLREKQPKAFIFENVKGLLRESFSTYFEYILLQLTYPELALKSGEMWQEHLERLERVHTSGQTAGMTTYKPVFRLVNAADYGVPQKRERVIIVGIRSDLHMAWNFPEPTHTKEKLLWDQWVTGDYWVEHEVPQSKRPVLSEREAKSVQKMSGRLFPPLGERWLTVRDALKGLPSPYTQDENGSQSFIGHLFRDGARIYPGHTGSEIDLPSKAIKAGDHGVPGGENMIRFPDGTVRYFTVRETARIQTFPDEYLISGVWTEAMRQLGNAVPVKLAHIISKSLVSKLSNVTENQKHSNRPVRLLCLRK